jgi:hypothetical protein
MAASKLRCSRRRGTDCRRPRESSRLDGTVEPGGAAGDDVDDRADNDDNDPDHDDHADDDSRGHHHLRPVSRAVSLLALVTVLVGCGGGRADQVLSDAAGNLGKLRSGDLTLRLVLSPR